MDLIPNGRIHSLHGGSKMNLTMLSSVPSPVHLIPFSTSGRSLVVYRHSQICCCQLNASKDPSRNSLVLGSRNRLWFKLPRVLVELSASSLLLVVLGISSFALLQGSTAHAAVDAGCRPVEEATIAEGKDAETGEDEQLNEAFENWKSKTYALTVPLKVVALQGSVPPAWIKEFIQSQGRRLKLSVQLRGSLEDIFSELIESARKSNASSKSALTADLITVGDSWLDLAIKKAMIEPMQMTDDYEWFRSLPNKWKNYLRRNNEGKVDPEGRTWAVPYRWGSMVIAFKKSKFDKLGLAPIQDWEDLWRPELAGRISMVDSPREIIGAVLKYMGASYNTTDIKEIPGGRSAVEKNLALLAKQVLLFDSANYLKAFSIGDAWVAVGWSSDIIPAAKRLSNVAVIVPKSGASLWADLWAVPATIRCPPSENIGGRIRGPSPLIHQWFDFCLQPARELPFKQGVFPGASPSTLENVQSDASESLPKGAPKMLTNLVAGIPPPDILAKCEFLEPLSEATLSDYNSLISAMDKSSYGPIRQFLSTVFQASWTKLLSLRNEV